MYDTARPGSGPAKQSYIRVIAPESVSKVEVTLFVMPSLDDSFFTDVSYALTVVVDSARELADRSVTVEVSPESAIVWDGPLADVLTGFNGFQTLTAGPMTKVVATGKGHRYATRLFGDTDLPVYFERGERTFVRTPQLLMPEVRFDGPPIVLTLDDFGNVLKANGGPVERPELAYRIEILGAPPEGAREEYASPPRDNSLALSWTMDQDFAATLAPSVTYVDDNKAADIENRMFAAGVGAGVSASLILWVVEFGPWRALAAAAGRVRSRRRWRRAVAQARRPRR
ncbi:hypothetical protein [Micromonospora sp. DH14]|uniref:hypothetical protein n=1 Tax=Micromonospora sp. DH14 TaxID=3040120 RepID=UPI0024414839|nr:hypothetical protein [Micromonospora sp. DH14]MDG9678933.1 hypothetical protein [Micromonospora sp. DH14]